MIPFFNSLDSLSDTLEGEIAKNEESFIIVKIPELLISQFFVTNETLYIYDGKNVNQYQLIKD